MSFVRWPYNPIDPTRWGGSGSNVYNTPTVFNRPTVVRRSAADQLAGVKSFIDVNGNFVWGYPPGTGARGRGVFPTWRHVFAWWEGALQEGYTAEDIGFVLQDLYDVWRTYVDENWPGDKRNDAAIGTSTEHMMPWQEGFEFPQE